MNRREFIEKACLTGAGIIAGTSMINSLGIQTILASPRPGVFRGNREIPLLLADTPELQNIGGAYHLELTELDKNILVVRTGDDSFTAVNIKCTHKGCDVAYQDQVKLFVCPCHDSRFDMEGKPKSGPAKTPLGSYETSFKDGELTVHVPVDGDTDTPPPAIKDSTEKK